MTSKEIVKNVIFNLKLYAVDNFFDNTEDIANFEQVLKDLERLEKINEVWHNNEPMESVDINDEHLQELYDYINKLQKENEQLKQQRDSLAINNGELCVKVTDLEKQLCMTATYLKGEMYKDEEYARQMLPRQIQNIEEVVEE